MSQYLILHHRRLTIGIKKLPSFIGSTPCDDWTEANFILNTTLRALELKDFKVVKHDWREYTASDSNEIHHFIILRLQVPKEVFEIEDAEYIG